MKRRLSFVLIFDMEIDHAAHAGNIGKKVQKPDESDKSDKLE